MAFVIHGVIPNPKGEYQVLGPVKLAISPLSTILQRLHITIAPEFGLVQYVPIYGASGGTYIVRWNVDPSTTEVLRVFYPS